MPVDRPEVAQNVRQRTRHSIRFPKMAAEQSEEWFEYHENGEWRRLRVHDYREIFKVPGLYEDLVYRTLKCASPPRIVRMLAQVLEDWPESPQDLRVLDLGAGNGIVAERLAEAGVRHVVGIDLIEEAAMAAERDRPHVYDQYLVADVTKMREKDVARMREASLNCLCTVAALGFGDIPPRAFAAAFNFVESPGWLAMAIKDDFLSRDDASGFSRLIRTMMAEGIIEVQAQFRYCHRLSLAGEKLFYVGVIARKVRDVPDDILDAIENSQHQINSNGNRSELITTINRSSS